MLHGFEHLARALQYRTDVELAPVSWADRAVTL